MLALRDGNLVGATTLTPLQGLRVPSTDMPVLRLQNGGHLLHGLLSLADVSGEDLAEVRSELS